MSTDWKKPANDDEFSNAVILRRVQLSKTHIDQLKKMSFEDEILILDTGEKVSINSELKRYLGKRGEVIFFEERISNNWDFMNDPKKGMKILGQLNLSDPKPEFTIGVPTFWFYLEIFNTIFLVSLLLFSKSKPSLSWIFLIPFLVHMLRGYILPVFWAERNILKLISILENDSTT